MSIFHLDELLCKGETWLSSYWCLINKQENVKKIDKRYLIWANQSYLRRYGNSQNQCILPKGALKREMAVNWFL